MLAEQARQQGRAHMAGVEDEVGPPPGQRLGGRQHVVHVHPGLHVMTVGQPAIQKAGHGVVRLIKAQGAHLQTVGG